MRLSRKNHFGNAGSVRNTRNFIFLITLQFFYYILSGILHSLLWSERSERWNILDMHEFRNYLYSASASIREETPTPRIERGNPGGKRFSRPPEYHCPTWA